MIGPAIDIPETRREKQFSVKARKAKGAHYTPDELAAFVADQISANLSSDFQKLRILDPACGDGILIHAISSKLGKGHQYEGYDIDEPALHQARKLLGTDFAPDSFILHH